MKTWPLDSFVPLNITIRWIAVFTLSRLPAPRADRIIHWRRTNIRFTETGQALNRQLVYSTTAMLSRLKESAAIIWHAMRRIRAQLERLRERKYRKEKPFAVMARNIDVARAFADLSPEAEALLTSLARPIVLVPAKIQLAEVAPGNHELGMMLPYAPLHHLLFAAGAPQLLVMTSANRSSEPIAYRDDEARERLAGIADAFLIGERPIARRVDDSVARAGTFGPAILRRSRGYAPGAVATLPTRQARCWL